MSIHTRKILRRLAYLLLIWACFYRFVYPGKKPALKWRNDLAQTANTGLEKERTTRLTIWHFLDNQDNSSGVQALVASMALIGIVLDLRATRESNAFDKQLFRNSQTPKLLFRVHHDEGAKYKLILLNIGGGEAIDVAFQIRYLENEQDPFTRQEAWPPLAKPISTESLHGKERLTVEVTFPESHSRQFWLQARCTDVVGREHRVHAWGFNKPLFKDPDIDYLELEEPIYRLTITSTHYDIQNPLEPQPIWMAPAALFVYHAWRAGAFISTQLQIQAGDDKAKEKLKKRQEREARKRSDL